MNKSTASPVCVTICLVLLSSRGLQCLPFQNAEQRHARQPKLAENRPEDAANASTSSPGGHLALLEQTLGTAASASRHGASMEPSGSSLNTTTVEATPQSILGVQSLLGHQRLPVYTTEVSGAAGSRRQLSSNEPETELNKNGPRGFLLAAAVTSSNPENVFSSPVGETTDGNGDAGGPNSTGNLEGDVLAPSILGKGENVHPAEVPQSTTEESVFWLPGDHLPSVLPPAGQSLDSERASDRESPVLATETTAKASLVSTEAFLNLEGDASDRWGHSEVTPGAATAVSATVLGHDDWDDTKPGAASPERATPAGLVHRPQLVTEYSPAEGRVEEDDEVKRVVTPRLSAPTVKGGQTVQTGSAQEPAQGGEPATLLPSQDLAQATNPPPEGQVPVARATEKPGQVAETHEALVTIDMTKSDVFQTPRDTLRGVTQETETAFHETDAVLPATVPGDFASLEATGDARVRELATQIPTVLSSSTEPRKPEDFAAATSPSATDMSVIPVLESGGPVAALRREEEDTPIDDMPATPAGLQTEEISGTTVPMSALPSAAAPARRITVLASHQITTAAAYSLEGLESEEEEEEEDEEEEDEEEEPDEEDEEEDDEDEKDANSMDESLDGDAGQSSFTLPGETSQDPLESLENPVGELSGVSYQVPGAIEWERQNQGLVRNWMKKLKDKAGYMSGMLVPVGVGIAGALMILVALYSVKIMNRQRRNGFKRHKQKREFNSMQDRVMLLADSSEDEF